MNTTIDTFINVAGRPTITRDPDAVLDYTVDFTDWVDAMADSLASHTASVVGCTVGPLGSYISGKKVIVWISGGVVGTPASATVRVTTAAGRVDDRTIHFKIKPR